MNVRLVAALSVVVALVLGGVTWWAVRDADTADRNSVADPTEPATTSSPTPSPSASPVVPAGRPVAACGDDSGRIPKAFWGMHLNDPIGDGFPDAPINAVNLTTAQTYWNQIETAPGAYDFSRLDQIVSTADERGAQPMLVMGFTPSFHAAKPESPTARATMPDLDAWRAWVTAVVERYGAQLDYQVWPEPNIISNWEGTPAQMARLTAVAGEIIHDRAPQAKVVAPATTLRRPAQRRWMDTFWSTRVEGSPVAQRVDAVALDPFPLEDGTPEDSLDLVCQAEGILEKHDVDAPVWTNEINYGVPSGGHATDVQHYADAQQAAVVARTYILQAALGLDRVYWLGWFSTPGMAVELARDGAPTPAAQAYERVHEWLSTGPRPRCRVVEGVHTCLVAGKQRTLRILWRAKGTSRLPAGDGATRLDTLDGGQRWVKPGTRIAVGQSPVAVVAQAG